MDKKKLYNLIFKDESCYSTIIIENGETKIGEVIKKYFKKIEKSNLLENNVSNIYFIYDAILIEPKDYDKTIFEYFKNCSIKVITVVNKNENLEYEIIEPIDENPFTSIYKAKLLNWYSKGEFVAVKKIFKDKIKKQMKYKKKNQ